MRDNLREKTILTFDASVYGHPFSELDKPASEKSIRRRVPSALLIFLCRVISILVGHSAIARFGTKRAKASLFLTGSG